MHLKKNDKHQASTLSQNYKNFDHQSSLQLRLATIPNSAHKNGKWNEIKQNSIRSILPRLVDLVDLFFLPRFATGRWSLLIRTSSFSKTKTHISSPQRHYKRETGKNLNERVCVYEQRVYIISIF